MAKRTLGEHWRDRQVAQQEEAAHERLQAQQRHVNRVSGFKQERVVYADEEVGVVRNGKTVPREPQGDNRTASSLGDAPDAPLSDATCLPLLLDLLGGKTTDVIARERALSRDTVDAFAQRQDVLEAYTAIRHAITQDILAGALGPVAMARATANEMVDRLLQLSRHTSTPPAVQHRSAIDLLSIAGYGPTRRVQNVSTDSLISQMSPEEIKRYADTGEWPVRFKDLLVQPRTLPAPPAPPDTSPIVDMTPSDEGAFLYEEHES